MLNLYTLKNCDTCKKALKWMQENEISFQNQDIRADGLPLVVIKEIVGAVGWEKALNRRSTTWRGLEDDDKLNVDNEKAVALIEKNPTLLKRPAFINGNEVILGFDEKTKQTLLSSS